MEKNNSKDNNQDLFQDSNPVQFKEDNPENQNKKTHRRIGFAHAANLLPAVLVASLVLTMIPQTRPVLDQVPALLTAKVEAAQTTEAAEEESAEPESQAQGNYEDGVYTGQASGYGGPVKVEVTVKDKSISSVEILSASKETASFFNRAKAVIDQVLLKQTWEVDTVSGATYSSKGILGAIQNALTGQKVENETAASVAPRKQSDVAFEEPSSYKDGTYTGTARGFGGNITMQVTIKDGRITDIKVVNASGETSSYFNRAKGVISRMLTKQSPSVDTVSGATYSSRGIINAVKKALTRAGGSGKDLETDQGTDQGKGKDQKGNQGNKNKKHKKIKADAYVDGTYTGTADGFGGPITVKVIVKNGKIKSISVVSAKYETQSYFKKARAVLKKMVKAQGTDVDVVSGATFSSNGLINATANALSGAIAEGGKPGEETEGPSEKTSEEESEAVPSTEEGFVSRYEDGTYTGIGDGFGGDIEVEVTIKNGLITSIEILYADDETPAYFNRAKDTVINEIITGQTWDVDVVTGATFSSNGIIDAVYDALSRAEKQGSGEEESLKESEPGETSPEESGAEESSAEESEESSEAESSPEESSSEESSAEESEQAPDESEESSEAETSPEESSSEESSEAETSKASIFKDGTYTASALCDDDDTFSYYIEASVLIENDIIKSITPRITLDQSDDPDANETYFGYAVNGRTRRGVNYPGIPAQILEKQSADGVDIVTGATYSSNSIIAAVKDALNMARTQ